MANIQGLRKWRTFINWLGNIKNWVLDQIWCIFLFCTLERFVWMPKFCQKYQCMTSIWLTNKNLGDNIWHIFSSAIFGKNENEIIQNFLVFSVYDFDQISTNKMWLLSHFTFFEVKNKTKLHENGINWQIRPIFVIF